MTVNTTRYELRYDRGAVAFNLPENVQVTCIRKPKMPLLSDARAAA